jgi:hypothetical protein
MLILRDPESAARIADVGVRQLVEQRFMQICSGEPYDVDRHGYMIVVEPGDGVPELEAESGCPILHDLFGEAHFGDPEFSPATEALEEHACCYELVFIFIDEGAGVLIFVPKVDGIAPDLLAMCATYAEPASELSSS